MARTLHTIVFCYDITRTNLRRRVAKLLEERMVRVQRSVFEARLHLDAANTMFEYLEAIIEEGDSIRMYVMQKNGLEKSRAAGGAPMAQDGQYWLA